MAGVPPASDKAADTAASTIPQQIRVTRGQKGSVTVIFFVTLRRFFGRKTDERPDMTSKKGSKKAETRKGNWL